MTPQETFLCRIVGIDETEVTVQSVSSDGEEAEATIPLSEIDPWRRRLGERFTLEIHIKAAGGGKHVYEWRRPRLLPLRHRRALREHVYPTILALTIGMFFADLLSFQLDARVLIYAGTTCVCILGCYLSRKRPRPSWREGFVRESSDD